MFAARRLVLVAAVAGLCGGVVVAAGGAHAPATAPVALKLIEMLDAERGYGLSGDPNLFRLLWTSDGGRTWRAVTSGRAPLGASSPVTILGRRRYFSTTLGRNLFAVVRSEDDGRTWRRSRPFRDTVGAGAVGQPFALDSTHLYVAIGEGAAAGSSLQSLWRSGDGGASWTLVSRTRVAAPLGKSLPFGCDKNGFGFSTPRRGWAGAYCAGGAPFLYRTDDGGLTWRLEQVAAPRPCACDTSAPRFFTRSDGAFSISGFAANGAGRPFARIFWTQDGGTSWRRSDPPLGRIDRAPRVALVGARTVWLVAQISANTSRVVRSSDGGRTWQATSAFGGLADYLLDPIDGRTAFAVSANLDNHSLLMTRNGGRSWVTVQTVVAR